MVGSWGRSEVGSAPSSNLVRRWGKTCSQKMGQPSLKTGAPSSDYGLVRRWGRPVLRLGRSVLRLGRSEDGAQHIRKTDNLFVHYLHKYIYIDIQFRFYRSQNDSIRSVIDRRGEYKCDTQECIPVGCALTAAVATIRCQYWGLLGRPLLEADPSF